MSSAAGRQHFRYPRTQPFEDGELDRLSFRGRDTEITELLQRISSTRLLVLYGRSGLGKTSLLQAGVYPRLRERDLLPLPVRVDQPDREPMEVFTSAVEAACRAQAVDYTPGTGESLWEFFKTAVFWREGELQTPVLVLDQFEELFTLHGPESRAAIVHELSDLMAQHLPDRVRARRDAGETLPYGGRPPLIKLLLSLRESHLGELEALTTALPQVLSDRFRLTALDRDNAMRAILDPAGLEQSLGFATAQFSFSEDAVKEMIDFLTGTGDRVEPFALQLLCAHVERHLVAGRPDAAGAIRVEAGDLGGRKGMENVLGRFYREVIRGVHGRRQRKWAGRLCTEGLLSPDGRRLSLEEEQILRDYRLRRPTLDWLVNERLVRREPRLHSFYYELSHDRLAAPVLRARRWQMPRWARITLATGALAVVSLAIFLFVAIVFAVHTMEQEQRVSDARDLAAQERDRAAGARDGANELISELVFSLQNRLAEIGRLDLMESSLESAREFYEGRRTALTVPEREAYGAILGGLGSIRSAGGRRDEARQALEASVAIYRQLASEEPPAQYAHTLLAWSLGQLARFEVSVGQMERAGTLFGAQRQALERALARNSKDVHARAGLAWFHVDRGDALEGRGDLAGAVEEYTRARSLYQDLARELPSDRGISHDLSAAGERLGNVHLARLDLDQAQAAYGSILERFRELLRDRPDSAHWRHSVMVTNFRFGEVHTATLEHLSSLTAHVAATARTGWVLVPAPQEDPAVIARLDEAWAAYGKAAQETAHLLRLDPGNPEWRRDRAEIAAVAGELVEAAGGAEEAAAYYDEAVDGMTALERNGRAGGPEGDGHTDLDTTNVLTIVLLRRARFHLRRGDWDRAADDVDRAHGHATRAVQASDGQARWRDRLAECLDGTGDVHLARAEGALAAEAYEKALAIREELSAASPDHSRWKVSLAVALVKAGSVAGAADGTHTRIARAREILQALQAEGRLPVFARIVQEMIAPPGS